MNRRTILLVAGIGALSCRGGAHDAATNSDAWYTGWPPRSGPPWIPLGDDDFFVVADDQIEDAIERLDDEPAIEVDAPTAARLAGGRSVPMDGHRAFLVRALALGSARNGAFSLRYRGVELDVSHGVMGMEPVPLVRQPIVVLLPAKPVKVYVSASMIG